MNAPRVAGGEWSAKAGPLELHARVGGFWSMAVLPREASGRCGRAADLPAAKQRVVDLSIAQVRSWLAVLLEARGERICAAPDCDQLFTSSQPTRRFHSERCKQRMRKRESWRKRAARKRAAQ